MAQRTFTYEAFVLLLFITGALFVLLPHVELKSTVVMTWALLPSNLTGQSKGDSQRASYKVRLQEQQARLEEVESELKKAQAVNTRLLEKQAGDRKQGSQGGEGDAGAGGAQPAEKCYEQVMGQMKDLPIAANMLRFYVKGHYKQLQERWQAQLSGQRQRGIVVPAGGDETVSIYNAFVTLYVLRHHLKCGMPAAIMYWGGKGSKDDISKRTRAIFQENISDLEFVDASTIPYPAYHRPLSPESSGTNAGWKVKAFSLYAAPFQEVLLLDSDSVPLLDPSCLFETQQYREHGTLFWRDCCRGKFAMGSRKLFRMLGLEGALGMQTDSGMFVFDRSRHWEALEWVLFLNSREDVVYRNTYGDKETYRVAFHLAGKGAAFQQVEHNVVYTLDGGNGKQSMIQLHPNGTALFHHLSPLRKYIPGRGPPPKPRLISARTSAEYGEALAIYWHLNNDKVSMVKRSSCNYSLWDWPAAEHSCAPQYDYLQSKTSRPLPVFEAPADSHLLAAAAVADKGFAKFKAAKRPHRRRLMRISLISGGAWALPWEWAWPRDRQR